MLVCHCEGVNDKAIRAEIEHGARDVECVAERSGAGVRCGQCVPVVETLLRQFGLTHEHAAA